MILDNVTRYWKFIGTSTSVLCKASPSNITASRGLKIYGHSRVQFCEKYFRAQIFSLWNCRVNSFSPTDCEVPYFLFFFLIKFHTLVVEVLEAALFLCPRDSRRPPPLSISIFPFRFYPGSYGTHESTSILYEYSLQNKNVDGRNRDKWVYSLSKKYFERVILKGESKSFRFLTRLSWFLPRRQRHDIYFCRIWRNKDLMIKIIYTPLECNGQRSRFAWTATKLWLELL